MKEALPEIPYWNHCYRRTTEKHDQENPEKGPEELVRLMF